MKRYIFSAIAGGALMLGSAMAQSTPNPEYEHFEHRQIEQSRRINQGLRNGTLTPAQAGALRRTDRRIAAQGRNWKAQQGGPLTAAEHRQMHNEMNRNSRRIYNAKH